ncbi:hypothetical protein GGR28_000210 [Lewinella aquimaris]|uniref:CHRD domain-containing protein n=1 Tax=Neolewinella aquimaris TaxID=1835722 RepID=A0A840E731_9BACT|nr:CHRD domain-containing protein [Neolewinella aquimaris]MBB4077609.1 hypothetical protein [Neolewinella aquimaris]
MRQRTYTPILTLILLLFGSAALFSQLPTSGTARLSGQQEVLPVITAATGMARVDFVAVGTDQLRVTVSGEFSDLSSAVATQISGGAHIHVGYPGQNGGVVIPLVPELADDSLSGTFNEEDNTFVVPVTDFEDVDVGQVYINIHTANYPGGELRGAVLRDGHAPYFTNLLGSNEVPSVISSGYGALLLQVDEVENVMVVTGSFRDLSDTLATQVAGGVHLHLGLPGQNGPVRITLNPTVNTDRRSGVFESGTNTFSVTEEQKTALRNGQMYANIHSGSHLSGELRGQVLPPADAIFRAHLSGANEWPVVTSGGSGQVLAHIVDENLTLVGSFSNLGSPVATTIAGGTHLHPGLAGENGPVLQALTVELTADSLGGSFAKAANTYQLTEDTRALLLGREIYLNVHSQDHPSGELRGQLLPESQAVFTAFLNGNQQIPSVITTGRGLVKVEQMGSRMTVTGSFRDLMSDLNTAIAGGAHVHAGYPGQAGPVIYPLNVASDDDDMQGRFMPMDNTFELTGDRLDTLTDRFFYVNVHSLEQPGGEIRGSALAEAESYFLGPLSGASEPQGVPTDATGMVAAEVTDSTVILVGSFAGLDSDFAADVAGGMHLHRAIAGSNGGIVEAINTEIAEDDRSGEIHADSNMIQLTAAGLEAMLDRMIYANVHTANNRGGAIRGQMLPLAGSYFHTTFSGVNEPAYVATTAQGGLKMELIDSTLKVSGSVTMLEGDFDASVAGGAHLHLAPAGQNGGIQIGLNATPAEDLKSATFSIEDNTFTLTMSQLEDLRGKRLYANVHTTMVRSGEARGQVLGELNLPPAASSITSPTEGDSLDLAGDADEMLRVIYESTTDVDGDTVIYIWQLAADSLFENVLFASNTGRDTFFDSDYATLDTLLVGSGILAGTPTAIYHRVLASDGSNYRPGPASSIVVTRGDIVGTRDFRPDGFAARMYPNPTSAGRGASLEIETRQSFRGRVFVYTQLGQLQQEIFVNPQPGKQTYLLETSALAAGTYFVTLRNEDGRLIQALRLAVQ